MLWKRKSQHGRQGGVEARSKEGSLTISHLPRAFGEMVIIGSHA